MDDDIKRLLDLIARFKLEDRSRIARRALALLAAGRLSRQAARLYYLQLLPVAQECERRPNLLWRPPEQHEIPLPPGRSLQLGHLVEAPEIPLVMPLAPAGHAAFVGATGGGKTITLRRIIRATRKMSFLVFDRKGYDYGDAGEWGSNWVHVDVHGALRLGLQAPQGVPTDAWVNLVALTFSCCNGLISSWITLADTVRYLISRLNGPGEIAHLWPDFKLILDTLRTLPLCVFAGKEQYTQSLIHALEGCVRASGSLFRSWNGLDLERDIFRRDRSIVISMPNLPARLNHFIVQLLVMQVLAGRIHRGHRTDDVEVTLVIDEGDMDASRDVESMYPGAMPPLVQALRQGREFGVAVWLGLAGLSKVSELIRNSFPNAFVFRLDDADSTDAAARMLQLPRNAHTIIPALAPGECLARVAGPWPHAMLARVDYVPPCRNPQPRFEANENIPAKDLADLPELLQEIGKLASLHREQAKARKEKPLEAEALALLRLSAENPLWPAARLFDRMTPVPPPNRRRAAYTQIQEGGHAVLKDVQLASKRLCLIELTQKGYELLKLPIPRILDSTTLVHRAACAWIARVGSARGFQVMTEYTVPGTTHRTDVAWCKDRRYQLFEYVATCDDNLASHLHASFHAAIEVERVTIVANQKSRLAELTSAIDRLDLSPRFEAELNFSRFPFLNRSSGHEDHVECRHRAAGKRPDSLDPSGRAIPHRSSAAAFGRLSS